MKFAFFGTPDIAVEALDEMERLGFLPSLIVCNPDAPVGRKHTITPPPTKVWAEAHGIPVFQPATLPKQKDQPNDGHLMTVITQSKWDFFVVFAYGKLIPEWLLSLPTYGTINAHPSLLPKFRGASPIRSTILHDLSAAGVTIIQMDKELDHGPILYQQPITLHIPIPGRDLDAVAGKMCGDLLVHVMQELPKGTTTAKEQDHTNATFCSKITKEMGEVHLDPQNLPTGDEALALYRKICAFDGWPGTFFFHHGTRIKITHASYDEATKVITVTHIIPEGKKEMPWSQYFH